MLKISNHKLNVLCMKKMLLLLTIVVSVAACKNQKKPEIPQVSLQNTRWQLKAIDGVDVVYPEHAKPADLLLEEGTDRISGFGACNRFFGSYESDGKGMIKFSRMASTQMACVETMGIENRYLGAFERVDAYEVDGETLYLKDGDKIVLTLTVAKEE